MLLLLLLPTVVLAQDYSCATNNGAITITGYSGTNAAVTIPDTINGLPVTSIGQEAFQNCSSLTIVTIGNSVANIDDGAFDNCANLAGVYFKGNAPRVASSFTADDGAIVYYLPGASGWSTTFGGLPTALWNTSTQIKLSGFGVRTNRFGFNFTGSNGLVIVVEACANLVKPTWSPLQTNTLSGGSSYFNDPQWTNYPARFYRLRSP